MVDIIFKALMPCGRKKKPFLVILVIFVIVYECFVSLRLLGKWQVSMLANSVPSVVQYSGLNWWRSEQFLGISNSAAGSDVSDNWTWKLSVTLDWLKWGIKWQTAFGFECLGFSQIHQYDEPARTSLKILFDSVKTLWEPTAKWKIKSELKASYNNCSL